MTDIEKALLYGGAIGVSIFIQQLWERSKNKIKQNTIKKQSMLQK